ncbi:MAG: M20/M25/M40 family metallo-hydrolase [Anaerolineae bacterium]
MSQLLSYFKDRQQEMVDLLTELVNFESGTKEKPYVDKLGNFMESQFRTLKASSVTRYPQTEVGDFLLAKWNENAPGKPIMFLTHIDTVWPIGTLAQRPVRIDDEGRLFGPGAIDMKGGITITLSAIKGLLDRGEMPNRPIWVLMTADEEVGSIYSEPIIREVAAQSGLVLVMEPATQDEALKTSRKGVSNFTIKRRRTRQPRRQRAEKGINAVVELAYQTLKLQEMNDLRNGTSVSVTVVHGGIATNVIPDKATAQVDVRTLKDAAYDELSQRIQALQPYLPGAKLTVVPGSARGPMERNALMNKPLRAVQNHRRTRRAGISEDSSGGGSDGNFTAHMGIPRLTAWDPQATAFARRTRTGHHRQPAASFGTRRRHAQGLEIRLTLAGGESVCSPPSETMVTARVLSGLSNELWYRSAVISSWAACGDALCAGGRVSTTILCSSAAGLMAHRRGTLCATIRRTPRSKNRAGSSRPDLSGRLFDRGCQV